jgi:hypothetical protein
MEAAVLDFCHQAQPIGKVRALFVDPADQGSVAVENLKSHGLLLERDGYFLSLVLPSGWIQTKAGAAEKWLEMIENGTLAMNKVANVSTKER